MGKEITNIDLSFCLASSSALWFVGCQTEVQKPRILSKVDEEWVRDDGDVGNRCCRKSWRERLT